MISPHTKVSFIYAKYRVVVAVDVSPSMFVLDPQNCTLPFDTVMATLESTLRGLASPVNNVESQSLFSPQIYLSIMARASDVVFDPSAARGGRLPWLPRFLVHGVLLSLDALPQLLESVRMGLQTMEMEMAQHAELWHDARSRSCSADAGAEDGVGSGAWSSHFPPHSHVHGNQQHQHHQSQQPNAPQSMPPSETATLARLLQAALFGLKLLPLDACPMILLVTDGARLLHSLALLHLTSRQFATCTASFSFFSVCCCFGMVSWSYHDSG